MTDVFLKRTRLNSTETFGELSDETGFLCYTIERPWLDNHPQTSCIPAGVYDVEPYMSPKHGKVWEVMNVPGRDYIEIHPANFAGELLGCIAPGDAVGDIEGVPAVLHSQDAFAKLKSQLPDEFTLTITQ